MIYTSVTNRNKVLLFSVIIFVSMTVFIYLGTTSSIYKAVFQAIAILIATLGAYGFIKYIVPVYDYVLENDEFIIRKNMNSSSVVVCRTELKNIDYIKKRKDIKNEKHPNLFNYGCGIFSKDCEYSVGFSYYGDETEVIITVSEEFANRLKVSFHDLKENL